MNYEMLTTCDTPLRAMSGLKGQMVTLMIGADTWIAPDPDGPWTKPPNRNPPDMEAFHKLLRDQLAANLGDDNCPGMVIQDGRSYLGYRYTSRTDPSPDQGGR
ncbi:hypothetical protein [Marimonas arenosa]|uniref:Uncharacterized protein n=1 Tax=Marimonas arenosa TaxID=1795305 RepID=A0AAE3WCC8_9RHOB|nr:hypothetical protein [Marimonas arenosa]MDQ2090616.1 hypothetical protein [Marimonas arenosa]